MFRYVSFLILTASYESFHVSLSVSLYVVVSLAVFFLFLSFSVFVCLSLSVSVRLCLVLPAKFHSSTSVLESSRLFPVRAVQVPERALQALEGLSS